MRPIESKPIPLKSRGLTGDLKRLTKPTDSFLIENKGLKRAVLYSTASRLGIRLITQVENDGLRVWRNFEAENPFADMAKFQAQQMHTSVDEVPMTHQEKLDNLRQMIESPGVFNQSEDEWAGWSEEQQTSDLDTGGV